MTDIIIIGAGLTGLSTAYHLEKAGFYNYKIFEKDNTIGGLCRSKESNGFTFDYTGHLLHISDSYFETFIKETINFENLNSINRRSFIYSQERYTRYPYQINLFGLPVDTITECIEGFLNRDKSLDDNNFHDWVLKHFGSGFGKNFFFSYQHKIFQYDIKKLATNWMGRFVPKTNLKDLISGAIADRVDENFGYNSKFFYPQKGGIESWVKSIAQKLKNKIYVNHQVNSIDNINKVVKFTNNSDEQYKTVINTMPLDILLSITKEPSNSNLKSTVSKLLCNTVVNFNLGVNRPDLSNKHWIYYPEDKYKFYRIGFPHNFSKNMAPEGCSSLYGEFSYLNNNKLHNNKLNSNYLELLLNRSLKQTKSLFNIKEHEILTQNIIVINHAYVIYNQWRNNNIDIILDRLKNQNIISIGRYGEWKYSSMQEAILDGKKAAEEILKNYELKINGSKLRNKNNLSNLKGNNQCLKI